MSDQAAKKRILVVDDEVDIARLLAVRLKASGYDVTSASNGEEAWEALQQSPPDIVISDVMMPPPNGYELCRRIKQDPRFQSIPVILLSAKSMASDRDEGRDAGADLYLTKPFNRDELLGSLQKLLA